MWLTVCRYGVPTAGLFRLHVRTAVRAIVGPAIGSVVITCRRAGTSLTSGRCRANRRESRRFDSVVVVVVQCVA